MRLLVCGSRDGVPWEVVWDELDTCRRVHGVKAIIEGCARGVDRSAEEWASDAGIPVVHCPADWGQHGRAAGHVRNHQMAGLRPDAVLAFYADAGRPSRGTAHMVKVAREKGITVIEVNAAARSREAADQLARVLS